VGIFGLGTARFYAVSIEVSGVGTTVAQYYFVQRSWPGGCLRRSRLLFQADLGKRSDFRSLTRAGRWTGRLVGSALGRRAPTLVNGTFTRLVDGRFDVGFLTFGMSCVGRILGHRAPLSNWRL
jgi:hypothetical protein